MSSETRQYVEELVALSPWVAFIVAGAWFWVLEVRATTLVRRVRMSECVQDNPTADRAQAERKYPAVGELDRFYASTSPRRIA